MRPVILLFAKAPEPGRVKTRLTPLLSASQAASLHTAFVEDMLELLLTLPGVDIELHTDTVTDAWAQQTVARKLQVEGDLGIKMHSAAKAALAAGRPQVLIAGSDSPTLPAAHLIAVLAAEADVTLGPADDGGYYAIAFRKTHPAMFSGVAWSTATTRADTVMACGSAGLTIAEGRRWWDVDAPADVVRLLTDPGVRRHTAAWLGNHGPSLAARFACARR
ncbi:MAG: TIGR04282 family arsenosugar biosynthesis glycosyltransferase [Bryobacteraceae bacterium]